ncbi:hypothetical protein DSO57_1016848 [Entomophthora muscae]|uniref:Uncharacterized protein n=1 Tax=Entomophthora muscae TaxID=34485 RepID=A0ACC2RJF0_9FUNG|nr:hypothetical protein DSO57_1016848 [Entomophthora muscae]
MALSGVTFPSPPFEKSFCQCFFPLMRTRFKKNTSFVFIPFILLSAPDCHYTSQRRSKSTNRERRTSFVATRKIAGRNRRIPNSTGLYEFQEIDTCPCSIEPASSPPDRALDQIIDLAHLSPLHQIFLCTSQPVNQMSLPIEESPYSSYDYSKLGFAYATLLGFTEQVIPHMDAW